MKRGPPAGVEEVASGAPPANEEAELVAVKVESACAAARRSRRARRRRDERDSYGLDLSGARRDESATSAAVEGDR